MEVRNFVSEKAIKKKKKRDLRSIIAKFIKTNDSNTQSNFREN